MLPMITPEPQEQREPAAIGLPRSEKSYFPELYETAAGNARSNQTFHFVLLRGELIAVVVAVATQLLLRPLGPWIANRFDFQLSDLHLHVLNFSYSISSTDFTNTVAGSVVPAIAVLFVLAFAGLRYYLKLDETWQERRALAEAVLVLVWRYSMRALPGDLPGADPEAKGGDAGFIAAYNELKDTANVMNLPPAKTSRPTITDQMRRVQSQTWSSKRTIYLRDRLDEQSNFYLTRAQGYLDIRNRLRWTMIACYIVGIILLPLNGLSTLTTIAGAFGTWLGAKHYSDLSQSYSAMQRDLEILRTRAEHLSLNDESGETKWGQIVSEIETRLEGEHNDWLRRIGPQTGSVPAESK